MGHHLSVLLIALFATACGDRTPPQAIDQSIRPARIFTVAADVTTEHYTFIARVEAAATIDMTFRVPGQLTDLPVLEGQPVEAGALIAAIDRTDYELALREAQVQRELAVQDLARKRKLLKERGVPKAVVDDARATFELRQVAVEKAQENLQRTQLRAPFSAFIARRHFDNYVNVRPGEPVVRLLDLSELFVIASIPETLLATVTPERVIGVFATFSFAPETRFELAFRENTGESNAVAQTYETTFVMPRPEAWNILPGMTATVEVELASATADTGLVIPTSALATGPDNRYFVWRFDATTGNVTRQAVAIGPAQGNGIVVLEGLKSGDQIVASGTTHLSPGMRVRALLETSS